MMRSKRIPLGKLFWVFVGIHSISMAMLLFRFVSFRSGVGSVISICAYVSGLLIFSSFMIKLASSSEKKIVPVKNLNDRKLFSEKNEVLESDNDISFPDDIEA